jgi:hypothetical protein
MHPRYQHRDHRGRLGLGDHLEHRLLEHRILEHHLDVGYQNQHRLDEVHHLDEPRHLDEVHRPGLGEHQQRHLDVEHHLGEVRDPCPG